MTIKASITAYSTAVGPSSDVRKRCSFLVRFFIWFLRLRSVAVALCQRLRPVKCQWGFVVCDTVLRQAFACGAVSKAPETNIHLQAPIPAGAQATGLVSRNRAS